MDMTLWIIVVTIAASFFAWNRRDIYQKWIFNPYQIHHQQEYGRFVTSGLIHINYTHLFFNMFALYFFGQNVSYRFGLQGGWIMLALYLLGIVVSSIPTFFKYREVPGYNSLGASGGVAAVVFSSIMFDPLNKIYLYFIPIGIPGFVLGILYIVYSYYQGKRMADNVNHDAHLFGSLFGVIFTVILRPDVIRAFFQQITQWSL